MLFYFRLQAQPWFIAFCSSHWFRGGRLAGRRVSWAYEFISFILMQVQRLILCMETVLRKSTRSSEACKRVLFAFTPTLRFFFPSQKVLGIGIGQQPKTILLPASVSIILTLCVCIQDVTRNNNSYWSLFASARTTNLNFHWLPNLYQWNKLVRPRNSSAHQRADGKTSFLGVLIYFTRNSGSRIYINEIN